MFLSRHRRGHDRFVWIKLACLVLGGVLGLVGMRRDSIGLVDAAIVIVLAGFALRFVPHAAVKGVEAPMSDAEPPAPGA